MNNIVIGNYGNGGLGDCLFFTASFRNNNGKVILHDDEQSKEVSVVFDGIADVEFSLRPPNRPELNCYLPVHRARKIMISLGDESKYCIPFIKLTESEINWGRDFVRNFSNPVVIINNNSGDWDKTNYRAHYVRGNPANIQNLCDNLIKMNYTPLQFGLKDENKFTKLIGAKYIQGLNIRETASCFYHIKKLIGTDSGLYHLMLSVGGKCLICVPEESKTFGYIYSDLLYSEECFEGEKVRVKYFKHEDVNINNYLNFNY